MSPYLLILSQSCTKYLMRQSELSMWCHNVFFYFCLYLFWCFFWRIRGRRKTFYSDDDHRSVNTMPIYSRLKFAMFSKIIFFKKFFSKYMAYMKPHTLNITSFFPSLAHYAIHQHFIIKWDIHGEEIMFIQSKLSWNLPAFVGSTYNNNK